MEQYAIDWRVDFLKNDCVFGEQFVPEEIITQSKILTALSSQHDIVYSLSPGSHASTDEIVNKAKQISEHVTMYRVTDDDWDNWPALLAHFDVAAAFATAGLIGAKGLNGQPSYPDLDMLPLGFITSPGDQHHYPTHFTNSQRPSSDRR